MPTAQLRHDRLPTHLHPRDSTTGQCRATASYAFRAWSIAISPLTLQPGYFHQHMEKASIPMRSIYDFDNTAGVTSAVEIDELADRAQSLEQRVASLNDSYEALKRREADLTEWRWVLREAGGFFDRVRLSSTTSERLSTNDRDRLGARLRRSGNQSTMTMTPRSWATWSRTLPTARPTAPSRS